MKRHVILLFALIIAICTSQAAEIQKSTHIYDITTDGDTLRLDRYTSGDKTSPNPVVIFAFGGSFRTGSRDAKDYLQYFEFLATEGYDVVSIDYRTKMAGFNPAGGITGFVTSLQDAITAAVEDMLKATAFIISKSDDWNINPTAIIASGSSAGAITALQAENLISASGTPSFLPSGFNYAGVVTFAGAVCAAGAPSWNAERLCPMLMFHGDVDTTVPFKKAEAMGFGLYGSQFISDQLNEMKVPHELYIINQADHSVAVTPMKNNLYDILSFLHEFVDQRSDRVTIVNQSKPGAPKDYNTDFSIMDYVTSNMPR